MKRFILTLLSISLVSSCVLKAQDDSLPAPADTLFAEADKIMAEHAQNIASIQERLDDSKIDFLIAGMIGLLIDMDWWMLINCGYFYRIHEMSSAPEVQLMASAGYSRNLGFLKSTSQRIQGFLAYADNHLLVVQGNEAGKYLSELAKELDRIMPNKVLKAQDDSLRAAADTLFAEADKMMAEHVQNIGSIQERLDFPKIDYLVATWIGLPICTDWQMLINCSYFYRICEMSSSPEVQLMASAGYGDNLCFIKNTIQIIQKRLAYADNHLLVVQANEAKKYVSKLAKELDRMMPNAILLRCSYDE